MLLVHLILCIRIQIHWQRRHPIRIEHILDGIPIALKHRRNTLFLALLLHGHQLLLARLADLQDIVPGSGLAADGQQARNVSLVDDGWPRVVAACITLPIRVVRNVGRGHRDGVVIALRGQRTGVRRAVLGIDRDTRGTLRDESEDTADALPDTV